MQEDKLDDENYSDKYLDEFEKESISVEAVLSNVRREKVVEIAQEYNPNDLLEIGPGLNPLISQLGGLNSYTGVEPSEEFAARLQDRLDAHSTQTELIQDRLEDLDPSNYYNSFDIIVASSVLHEVQEPRQMLRVIHSIAGEETLIHLNVPNMKSFHRVLAVEAGIIDDVLEKSGLDEKYQRVTNFNREILENMVTEMGFEVVEFGTYFVKPLTNEQLEHLINHGVADKSVLLGLKRMAKYLPEMGSEMYMNLVIEE